MNGTVASLIRAYQTDKVSPFRKVKPCTRTYYISLCNRLDWDHGPAVLADLKYRDLLAWYEEWRSTGKIAMAHSLVCMLRIVVGFGATIMEDDACLRLSALLRKLNCEVPPARKERLTAEQAVAVCLEAHARGLHSIAMAQAFQFECTFRQKDCIGEWVPQFEDGTSEVLHDGKKWLRGLRWSEIDEHLILRHITSKKQKLIEIDLKLAPMVIEELKRAYPGFDVVDDDETKQLVIIGRHLLPASGPVIVSDTTRRPWVNYEFRRVWRSVARAVGVPDTVQNRDSRAGAITEAYDAGADPTFIQKTATHSTQQMSQRYNRGDLVKATSSTLQARVAFRKRAS